MSAKILVCGGAGYIGSHVVDLLVRQGRAVVVLDSLVKGHRDAVPAEAELVVGDCGDPGDLARAFQRGPFEAVMHFAAFIEAGESMRDPQRFFSNNTAATLRLLEAAVDHQVGKFIFSSTAAIYGDPQYVPIDEDHPRSPTNAYGQSKLLVEEALAWLGRLKGLRVACLRYFNAAGCTERLGERHDPETHLIPLVLEAAAGSRPHISIFGSDYPTPDGTCVRDYIHVSDLAQAHLLALEALARRPYLAYNLGNGKGHSVLEVIEAARKVTGRPIPVRQEPRRAGDPAVLVASSAKIQAELGWVPQIPDLEAIIASAWSWRTRNGLNPAP